MAKVLARNDKLRQWYETPEFLIADDGRNLAANSNRKGIFARNPFSRNNYRHNDFDAFSVQSGSTTASFIAPVNVGEQVFYSIGFFSAQLLAPLKFDFCIVIYL